MKKYLSILVFACIMLLATSCKSSESNYRMAYEKAKAAMNDGVSAETTARIETEKKAIRQLLRVTRYVLLPTG